MKKQAEQIEGVRENQQKIMEASNLIKGPKPKDNPTFGEAQKPQKINQGTPCKSCGKK